MTPWRARSRRRAHVVEHRAYQQPARRLSHGAARSARPFDRGDGRYTLFTTSQIPHGVRAMLCHQVLGIPETDFASSRPMSAAASAPRFSSIPEETVLTWACAKLDRPVAWRAERSEAFSSTHRAAIM